MLRPLALLAALLATSFTSLAHSPVGTPDPACESGEVHDYALGVSLSLVGRVGPFYERVTADGSTGDLACNGGLGDGHEEFALDRAYLAVVSGDGVSNGALACHGTPGHHTATVNALDAWGRGPVIHVGVDHTDHPTGPAPDCGDGYVNPCDVLGHPPFPVGVLLDTVRALEHEARTATGLYVELLHTCNPDERVASAGPTPSGPTTLTAAFPPGADGAYVVFLDADGGGLGGHVWTS